jgi:hypothetical protein
MNGDMSMSDTERAEKILTELRGRREAAIGRGVALGEERTQLAFGAHALGDAKARRRLDEINREAALHESELRSLGAAIAEAEKRRAAAERDAAQEEDRKAARRLRTVAQRMKQRGKNLDAALAIVIDELVGLKTDVDEIHRFCGLQFPSHQQRDVFSYHALLTALKRTSFDRRFEPISSVSHITFRALTANWGVTLEKNAGARLGEVEQPTEAA